MGRTPLANWLVSARWDRGYESKGSPTSRITGIGYSQTPGPPRVEARVIFEDTERPPVNLFFETSDDYRDSMHPDPNALLVSCLIPAWREGESRVLVDEPLCPILAFNLRAALAVLDRWYGNELGPYPSIESAVGYQARTPLNVEACSLLSCGIDSLATLRWNRLKLPRDHPDAIGGVITVAHGEDPIERASSPDLIDAGRKKAVVAVAAAADADAIPVRTNLWWLADDGHFYDRKWHGAFLASLAMMFGSRFHLAYVSSSRWLGPWGSQAGLDGHYSSSYFRTQHYGFGVMRFEKTRLVADWPTALNSIRVCQNDDSGSSNCGTCMKCIETMTALVALGRLADSEAFDGDDVSSELIGTIIEYKMMVGDFQVDYFKALLPDLRRRGRDDLSRSIIGVIDDYQERRPASNDENALPVFDV